MGTELRQGDVVAGRYRIERKIGEGGMGAVYEGRDTKGGMEKPIALKVLHPALATVQEVRERFLREARSAARLDHPNIVGVTDVDVDGESLFMVLELLKGESLHERLQSGPLATTEACDVMDQILHGVAAAHVKGIVHRDLKPENIFMAPSRKGVVAKILDFGIARVREEGGRQTRTGMLLGTPDYMAPEQLLGESVDHRVDIWAMGVILYEMFVGDVPFKGATTAAIMQAIAQSPDPLPLPTDIPSALAPIIRRALRRNPTERFQSAEKMRLALEEVAKTFEPVRASTPVGAFVAPEASANEETVVQTAARNATETSVAWTTARMRAIQRRSRISAIGGSAIVAIMIATVAAVVLNSGKPTRRPTPVAAVAAHVAEPRPTPVTIVTPASIPAPSPVEVAVTPPPQVRAPPPLVAARNGRHPIAAPRVVRATVVAEGPTPQVPIPVAPPPVPTVVEPPAEPPPPPPRHPPPRTCANPDGCE